MKLKMIIAFCLMGLMGMAQNSFGEITGYLYVKADSEEKAGFATVWVEDNGSKIAATTDVDGKFRISAVPAGLYKLHATYMGDSLQDTIYCEVLANGIRNMGRINIYLTYLELDGPIVYAPPSDLINFGSVGESNISALDIMKSPDRQNPVNLIISKNSDIKVNDAGQMMIRGSRPGDMAYFVDGVKTRDAQRIPGSAIAGITVYTSAIPAKYGDTMGGVIIMNTKSYADIYRRWKIMTTRE